MTTIGIQLAPRIGPAHPRGSRLVAWLFLAIGQGLQALFSRPAAAAPAAPVRSPEQEAQAVRELAQQYLRVDPRFAAELIAAADRHERLHGVG